MANVTQKFKADFEKWLTTAEETASMRIKGSEDDVVEILFEDYNKTVSITVPDDPGVSFYVHTEVKGLGDWASQMNDYCDTCGHNIEGLLTHMASSFVEAVTNMGEEGEYEDEYVDEYGDDYGADEYGEDLALGIDFSKPEPKKVIDPVEQELQKQRTENLFFENIGSKGATMRLFDDLKNIRRTKPKDMGFSCQPVTINGKMNLYEWEVRLFDFEGPLAQDMIEYQKKTGKNCVITLSMKFSADYPFKPPFIRVVEPRFQFRTGHVTLGGAICMELLTVTGWTANNDITSILIQVRAEIGSLHGGARLAGPTDQSSYTPYSEQEAWAAFYRAANNHGWKTEGLGPNMFPKI